jgi:WD40 repeat protein
MNTNNNDNNQQQDIILLKEVKGLASNILTLVLSYPDGKYLFTGLENGQIGVWLMPELTLVCFIGHENSFARCICSSHNGDLVASGGFHHVLIWQNTEHQFHKIHQVNIDDEALVDALTFSPSGEILVCGDSLDMIRLIQVGNEWTVLHLITSTYKFLSGLIFIPPQSPPVVTTTSTSVSLNHDLSLSLIISTTAAITANNNAPSSFIRNENDIFPCGATNVSISYINGGICIASAPFVNGVVTSCINKQLAIWDCCNGNLINTVNVTFDTNCLSILNENVACGTLSGGHLYILTLPLLTIGRVIRCYEWGEITGVNLLGDWLVCGGTGNARTIKLWQLVKFYNT